MPFPDKNRAVCISRSRLNPDQSENSVSGYHYLDKQCDTILRNVCWGICTYNNFPN